MLGYTEPWSVYVHNKVVFERGSGSYVKEYIGCLVQRAKRGTKPGSESENWMGTKSHQEHSGTNFLESKWW